MLRVLYSTRDDDRGAMGICCSDAAAAEDVSRTRGGGKALGGAASSPGASAAERRAKAAEAAERRAKTGGGNVGGVNGQDMTSVKERQERDALVGKIEAMYAARGRDPPFGLRAATLAALKKHLKTARQLG